jgi:hypothetical protein
VTVPVTRKQEIGRWYLISSVCPIPTSARDSSFTLSVLLPSDSRGRCLGSDATCASAHPIEAMSCCGPRGVGEGRPPDPPRARLSHVAIAIDSAAVQRLGAADLGDAVPPPYQDFTRPPGRARNEAGLRAATLSISSPKTSR